MIKKLDECRNEFLSIIYGRLSELKTCEKLVLKHLPEKIAQHCEVSDTRNGVITITIANTGVFSLLRYEKSELLKKLRMEETMHALRSIELKLAAPHIRSLYNHSQNTPSKSVAFSQKSYENIQETAAHCTYTPLKEALERLAKTLRGKHLCP